MTDIPTVGIPANILSAFPGIGEFVAQVTITFDRDFAAMMTATPTEDAPEDIKDMLAATTFAVQADIDAIDDDIESIPDLLATVDEVEIEFDEG